MADSKDFIAGVDSNAKKSPRRIVFITRRTSAQVKAETEDQIQTFPEVLFRAAVAIMTISVALIWMALLFNAPLEGLADPSHTPNPAKAPWYFLGLQELLHYFPPVVAGVLIPGLVVMALIVIPYFKVNIEADGLFQRDRERRLRIFYVVAGGLSLFLLLYKSRLYNSVLGIKGEAIGFVVPTLSGGQATLLLGDDLVLIRAGSADCYRHIFPRPRLGLGLAVAGLIKMIIRKQ
jgi:quinol-cytochrome oxidoreductase complex cytochrome b subunit